MHSPPHNHNSVLILQTVVAMIVISILFGCHLILSTVESLTTGSGIVDQFLLTSVQESQHQLALLTDVIVEVHLNQSIPLSEEELSEIYNPAFIYSEVSVIIIRAQYNETILQIYQTAHWCMENGLLPQILGTYITINAILHHLQLHSFY